MKVTQINRDNITNEIIKKVLFSIPNETNACGDVAVVFGSHEKALLEERILYALKLYNQKKVLKILLTGGTGFQGDFNESDMMYHILIKNNVDKDDILIENKSRNTEENIINTIDLLKSKDLYFGKKIILLSNQGHFIRIKLLLDKLDTTNVTYVYASPINDSLSYENIINNLVLKDKAINQVKKIIKYINEGILDDFDI